jgi:hypothetical protein
MLPGFLNQAFAGMNSLFDQHGFPESELEAMRMGLVALIEVAAAATGRPPHFLEKDIWGFWAEKTING